jgi:hypothetical protein
MIIPLESPMNEVVIAIRNTYPPENARKIIPICKPIVAKHVIYKFYIADMFIIGKRCSLSVLYAAASPFCAGRTLT